MAESLSLVPDEEERKKDWTGPLSLASDIQLQTLQEGITPDNDPENILPLVDKELAFRQQTQSPDWVPDGQEFSAPGSPVKPSAVVDAASIDPAQLAQAYNRSARSGVSVEAAQADPAGLDFTADYQAIHEFLETHPLNRQVFNDLPDYVAPTRNQLTYPSMIETAFEAVGDTAGDVISATSTGFGHAAEKFEYGESLRSAADAALHARDNRSPETTKAMLDAQKRLRESGVPNDHVNGFFSALGEAGEILGQMYGVFVSPRTTALVGGGMVVGGTAGAAGGPLAPATVTGGMVVGGLAGLGSAMGIDSFEQNSALLYADLIEEGIDPEVSKNVSIGAGALMASLDVAGVGLLARPAIKAAQKKFLNEKVINNPGAMRAMRRFFGAYSIAVLGETITEVTQEVVGEGGKQVARDIDDEGASPSVGKTWEAMSSKEAQEKYGHIASKVFQGMLFLGAAGPVSTVGFDIAAARKAKKNKAALDAAVNGSNESEMRGHSPLINERYLGAMAEQSDSTKHVYIDSAAFNAFWQNQGIDPSAAAMELGVDPLEIESIEEGGDVRIPTGRFINVIGPSQYYDGLSDHVRFSAEQMSFNDARIEFEEYWAAVEEHAEQLAEEGGAKTDQEVIFDTFFSSLREAGFSVDRATVLANMMEQNVMAEAAMEGRTGLDHMMNYPIEFERVFPGVSVKSRPDLSLDPIIERALSGERHTQRNLFGPSLLEFMSEGAGLSTRLVEESGLAGDLEGIDQFHRERPGRRAILREDGIGLDDMALAAQEAGYFPGRNLEQGDRVDLGELLTAVRDELQGQPRFVPGGENPEAQALDQSADEVAEWLSNLDEGVAEEMSVEQIRQMIQAERAREDGDPLFDVEFDESAPGFMQPDERMRISTRLPTAVGRTEDPVTDNLSIGLDEMKADPASFKHNVNIMGDYPNFRRRKGETVEQRAERYIEEMVSNLLWLHDQVPVEIRGRSRLWYNGARNLTNRWMTRYNLPEQSIGGTLAALSPQMDWFQNVSLAERVLDVFTSKQDHQFDAEMLAIANSKVLVDQHGVMKDLDKKVLDKIKNKKLSELDSDLEIAYWIRIYDEAHNTRHYRIVTPEGDFGGWARNIPPVKKMSKKEREADPVAAEREQQILEGMEGYTLGGEAVYGPQSNVAWGGFGEIAKAVSVIRDPSYENVTVAMGAKHKVRNFYNNIVDPDGPHGDVTIDTHAVAAALLRPLGGSATEVGHNLATGAGHSSSAVTGVQGTYGIYAEAYRRAAEKRGLLPREMQSITWEAVRGLFTQTYKSSQENQDKTAQIWDNYAQGKITLKQAREQIHADARGIDVPAWLARSDREVDVAERDSSYESELSGPVRVDGGRSPQGARRGAGGADTGRTESLEPVFLEGFFQGLRPTGPGNRSREQDQAAIDADPRMSRDFSEVTARDPELTAAAQDMGPEYQETADRLKPVHPYTQVPRPATKAAMSDALGKKADKIGAADALEDGRPVGLRLDIPAYKDKGVWVPTVHDTANKGRVVGYESAAHITGPVRFDFPEGKALRVAQGAGKSPFAHITGKWKKTTPRKAAADARKALDDYYNNPDSEWVQVGMDPTRHSQFYDRETQEPISGAAEVIQVGPLVMARKPKYAPRGFFQGGGPRQQPYSAVERAADDLKVAKGTGEQFLAALKKTPGVREEEIAAIGLDDFLAGKKGLTREAVQAYIRDNKINIVDVTLEGDDAQYQGRSTTLPGGDNYREVLFTMPVDRADDQKRLTVLLSESKKIKAPATDFMTGVVDFDKLSPADVARLREINNEIFRIERGAPTEGEFVSGHFDEPNILAHVRVDDRKGPNGEKILFAQEIQSDWHQKGRKEGYALPDAELEADLRRKDDEAKEEVAAAKGELENAVRKTAKQEGDDQGLIWDVVKRFSIPELQTWASNTPGMPKSVVDDYSRALLNQHNTRTQLDDHSRGVSPARVPDAPFKGTWHQMAFRRLVQMAVEGGYDQVAWTPGEMQAERYDLSKQVSGIDVVKRDDGTFEASAWEADGQMVLDERAKDENALAGMIGRELAQSVLESEDAIVSLRGDDLKVGGEGMKSFYDKMVKNYASKYGKKFGAKVGTVKFEYPEAHPPSEINFEDGRTRRYSIYEKEVWSLPVTDRMRQSITQEGIPLFQGMGIDQTESREFKEWAGEGHQVLRADEVNDADFTGQGPFVVNGYHGTTHEFDEFDATRGNVEGHFGRMNYITTSEYDAEINYLSDGPDLKVKIAEEAEKIAEEIEEASFRLGRNVSSEEVLDRATAAARKRVAGDTEIVHDLWVRMEKPFVIGGRQQDWVDFVDREAIEEEALEVVADQEGITVEELAERRDEFEGKIDEAWWESEGNFPNSLVEAAETVARQHDGISARELAQHVAEFAVEERTTTEIEHFFRGLDVMHDAISKKGRPTSSQMISEVIQEMGYDAIILKDADQRFKNMDMEQGTAHIHVFHADRTNIKSVANVGTFDRSDPNIFRQDQQQPRAQYIPATEAFGQGGKSVMQMFQGENPSSVIHELGHFFLEKLRARAAQDASGQSGTDFETLNQWWFSNADEVAKKATIGAQARGYEETVITGEMVRAYIDSGKRLSGVDFARGILPLEEAMIVVGMHEYTAEGFETYMGTSRAPSVELEGVFERIALWINEVYKDVKAALGINLTPEVEAVFDRMLATQEQIDAAQEAAKMDPLLLEQFGDLLDEAQLEAYQKADRKARWESKRKLTARKAREEKRLLEKQARSDREKIYSELENDARSNPLYRAWHWLATGEDLMGELEIGHRKLDREALVAQFGPTILGKMPKGRTIHTGRGVQGIHPDTIAEVFGFANGQEMLELIIGSPTRLQHLKAETDRIFRERHGDPKLDGEAAEAAMSAVHNDERGRVLEMELMHLRRKVGGEELPAHHARNLARRALGERRVRDVVSPGRYRSAEQKAAREVAKALANEDYEAAERAQQARLLNHYLYIEADKAKDELDSIVKYLRKFNSKSTRGRIDVDYLDQIDQLLETFELRAISLKAADKRSRLSEWVDQQRDAGEEVAVPADLIDASRKNYYKNASMNELRGLRDAVKNIEHLGKMKRDLLHGKKKKEEAALTRSLVSTLYEAWKYRKKKDYPNLWDKTKSGGAGVDAMLLKPEQLFEWMDGEAGLGPWQKFFMRLSSEAQDAENDLNLKYTKQLIEMMDGYRDKRNLNERFHALGREWTRADFLAMALNVGNESNLDKMLRGHGWIEEEVMAALEENMSQDDALFLQQVWDMIESLWPEIAKMERRMSGVVPDKIEAREIEVAGEKLRGGYFPVVYDPAASQRAFENEEKRKSALFDENYVRATTDKGHTKSRVEGATGQFLFDLTNIPNHLTRVIHDLTHREAIMSMDRIIRDPEVSDAMRDTIGEERRVMLQNWVKAMASDRDEVAPEMRGVVRAMRALRHNTTIVALGWKVTTMLVQPSGAFNAMEVLGDGSKKTGTYWFRRGAAVTLRSSNGMFGEEADNAFKAMMEASGEMRHRMQTIDRDIRSAIDRAMMEQAQGIGRLKKFKAAHDRFAFYGIGYFDRAVSVPAWYGGYFRAVEEMGYEHDDAVHYADKVVRLSQGAGATKDMAAIQRAGEWARWSTLFYTFFSAMYARLRNAGKVTKSVKDVPHLAAKYLYIVLFPAVLGELMAGRGPEPDEDETDWWLSRILTYPFMTIPVVRDMLSSAVTGFGFKLSPAAAVFDEMTDFIGEVVDQFDPESDADLESLAKGAYGPAQYIFKIPAQWGITGSGVGDMIEGGADFQARDLFFTKPQYRREDE